VFHSVGRVPGDFALLWNWIEQKLTEARAEMVERCAMACQLDARLIDDASLRRGYLMGCADAKAKVYALSPDPEWLERQKQRWELKAQLRERKAARGDAFCVSVPWAMKRNDDRIADLERQLAALPKEIK
jgi:hypothetical protein